MGMIHPSKSNSFLTKEGMSRIKCGLMESGFTGQKDPQLSTQESKQQATETMMESYSPEQGHACEQCKRE